MAIDPRETRQEQQLRHAVGLGFQRTPSEDDPRREPKLLAAIAKVAPGSELRQAIDDIIRSHEGALIIDAHLRKLAWANVQLMPDPTIPSDETGTRHRTAERVAKQTGALVVSISQQRSTISVFAGPVRYQLDSVPELLAKTNQALATLETYRQRLEQVLTRLPAIDLQNAVVLDDVLVVLQRAQMTTRMAAHIERDCVELGTEGRLIGMQLNELVGDVPPERDAVVRDYHAVGGEERVQVALEQLQGIPYTQLLDFER